MTTPEPDRPVRDPLMASHIGRYRRETYLAAELGRMLAKAEQARAESLSLMRRCGSTFERIGEITGLDPARVREIIDSVRRTERAQEEVPT